MEAYQGIIRNYHAQTTQKKFQAFLESVPVLPFSLSVAERCAVLRERLKQEGKRIKARALDVMNAAIALEHDLELVTRNREDYEGIAPYKCILGQTDLLKPIISLLFFLL